MRAGLRLLKLSALSLMLGLCAPMLLPARARAQEGVVTDRYREVHGATPAWLAERFEATVRAVAEGSVSPKASPEDVRNFLRETYEHIREVNALTAELGGKSRPIPETAPKGELRGVHDFGEFASTRKVREFLDNAKANPLKDRAGNAIPVPQWLENLVTRAEASGQRSIDVGKLAPWVAAGLGRNGPPDIYSIKLHNLAPHHHEFRADAKVSGPVIESIADRVNAMRQVRIYRKTPLSYDVIRGFLMEDVKAGRLPTAAEGLIERAIESQQKLERSGRVNPYHMLEEGQSLPRRSDGSVNWKALTARELKTQGAGLAHFTFALFLKELAAVVQTGDRLRMEEFFDGLASTDFFVNYGLFAAGAQSATVLYGRTLEKVIKPQFVNGLLRTNIVLAAGMALPELVHGNFDGKVFAIDVASLGLSSAAVKGALAGMERTLQLEKLMTSGRIAGAMKTLRPFAKAGGWLYMAAETAVILTFGDMIADGVKDALDERAARDKVADTTEKLLEAARDPKASEDQLAAALTNFEGAQAEWRNSLYGDLAKQEALYQQRLTKAAREAKTLDDKLSSTEKQLDKLPALRDRIIQSHGSVEAYLKSMEERGRAEIQSDLASATETYEAARRQLIQEAYQGGRRSEPYLAGAEVRWAAEGGVAGASGDPYAGRSDIFARFGRKPSRILGSAARDISENRIQAYDDQISALQLARGVATESNRAALDAAIERARSLRKADQALFSSLDSSGASGALGEALKR